jgi:hypothetical protein
LRAQCVHDEVKQPTDLLRRVAGSRGEEDTEQQGRDVVGADTVVWLVSSAQVESVTGGYFINRKPPRLSRAARDRLAAHRLWAETERMLANGRP